MADDDMPEHWLLEYINFDACESPNSPVKPPASEEDHLVTSAEGEADDKAGSAAGKTEGNAADHTPIPEAGNETSIDALHNEEAMVKGNTAEETGNASRAGESDSETGNASRALDNNDSGVEKRPEGSDTPAPRESGFPENQPPARHDVGLGAGQFQPHAPDPVETKPEANQHHGPSRDTKVKKASKPRAPTDGKTNPGFTIFSLEAVQKAPMSVGARNFNRSIHASPQTNSQSSPTMQNVGMPAGDYYLDTSDQLSHQHQTRMPVQDFGLDWANQPAPMMQTAAVPPADSHFRASYEATFQSAHQMQSSGISAEVVGQPWPQTNPTPSPLPSPKFTDEDFERALELQRENTDVCCFDPGSTKPLWSHKHSSTAAPLPSPASTDRSLEQLERMRMPVGAFDSGSINDGPLQPGFHSGLQPDSLPNNQPNIQHNIRHNIRHNIQHNIHQRSQPHMQQLGHPQYLQHLQQQGHHQYLLQQGHQQNLPHQGYLQQGYLQQGYQQHLQLQGYHQDLQHQECQQNQHQHGYQGHFQQQEYQQDLHQQGFRQQHLQQQPCYHHNSQQQGYQDLQHQEYQQILQQQSFQRQHLQQPGYHQSSQQQGYPQTFERQGYQQNLQQQGSQQNLQNGFQHNIHQNPQQDVQENVHQGSHQSVQSGFPPAPAPAPAQTTLPTPQPQASSRRRKPALAGKQTRPKAINPNVQGGVAQNQDPAKTHGKRKVSGEEAEPRRVSAGKTEAGDAVVVTAKARKKTKQSTFTLRGTSQTRKYRNHIMTSYHCSDGIIRILAGKELEEAQARTEAKKAAA